MTTKKTGRPRHSNKYQRDKLKAMQKEIDSIVAHENSCRTADELRRLMYLRNAMSRVKKRLATGQW